MNDMNRGVAPFPAHASECVLFFVRDPAPGLVKSRLAATVGAQQAAGLYGLFVQDMYASLRSVGAPVVVFHHPPGLADGGAQLRQLLGPDALLAPQTGADLGERMANALEDAFAHGCERAVLVGSDLPDLPADIVAHGLHTLREQDCAVLGPADDGGYYLVGFSRNSFAPQIFRGMRWSTPHVLRDTLAALREAGVGYELLEQWNDVDDATDLAALLAPGNGRRGVGNPAFRTSRTHAALAQMEDMLQANGRGNDHE